MILILKNFAIYNFHFEDFKIYDLNFGNFNFFSILKISKFVILILKGLIVLEKFSETSIHHNAILDFFFIFPLFFSLFLH